MSSSSPRVAVVIPNWNGLSHLPECLASLAAQSLATFEVIVVDNASSDASVPWLREHHPSVRVLVRPDNGGFSRAVNAGILATESEYVALLNNDTAVDPHWLERLVAALDAHPHYEVAASKMILYSHPERLNAAGDVYVLQHLAAANRGLGEPVGHYNAMERVLGACAGAALYRRSVFRDVGLFDEDFFLMSEDTDFSLRCLVAGKRCLYVPSAEVRHKGRASIETRPTRPMLLLRIRNDAMVAAKDLPAALLPLAFLLLATSVFRDTIPLRPTKWRRIPALLRLLPERCGAVLTGVRMGLAKRGPVWQRKAVGTPTMVRWLIKGHGPA